MASDLPVSGVVPISNMAGEDEDETGRRREMEKKARDFITNFEWCHGVRNFYFGEGVVDVVAVFLAHIEPGKYPPAKPGALVCEPLKAA